MAEAEAPTALVDAAEEAKPVQQPEGAKPARRRGCLGGKKKEEDAGEEGKDGEDGPHPKDVKQKAPAAFDGFLQGKRPDGKSRKCTDLLCLCALLGCWIGQGMMSLYAYNYAAPRGEGPGPLILLNGVDYKGRICGLDEGVEEMPYWTLVAWTGLGKCTASCPSTTNWEDVDPFSAADIDKLICKEDADQDDTSWKQFPFYKVYFGDCIYSFQSVAIANYCVINDMSTIQTVMSKVLPFDDDTPENDQVSAADLSDPSKVTPKMMLKRLTSSTSFFTDAMGDAYNARQQIAGFGFGFSIFLSFMYSHAMKISFVTNLVVWGSIWTIFFTALVASGYAYYTVSEWRMENPQTHTPKDIKDVDRLSQVGFGFAVFWLCFILYMKDRLNLAIGLVIETSRALASMTTLVISIPVFQLVFYIAATVPWLFGLVYMASMGQVTTTNGSFNAGTVKIEYAYKQFSFDEQQQQYGWFYLFGYFWTSEFIVALGQMITSMALCCYYFTRDKKKIGNTTVFSALRLVVRYHLGTVAFGSCIVALVRLLRAYIRYLEATALKNQTKFQKMAAACLECFMWCIERCIKYINFNAYIQTCIWGNSFCVSAFNAFWLIFRNLARIVAVTGVTGFLSFIGKLMVIAISGGAFFVTMEDYYPDVCKSLLVPTALVCFVAAAVAIMFFEVFNMGTTVLLQCYIADEEMFKDDPEGCFAPMTLKAYLISKKKKKKAKKKGGSRASEAAADDAAAAPAAAGEEKGSS